LAKAGLEYLKGEDTMKKITQVLVRLWKDEQGAEGLEKLLIIAAIVLPLLGLLIVFRQNIGQWVSDLWNSIRGEAETPVPMP
jgi:Flp pilus assembly pilin Flp